MDNTSDLNQIYEKTKTTGSSVDLDNLVLEQAKQYYQNTPSQEKKSEQNYYFAFAASFIAAVLLLFFLTRPEDKLITPIEVTSTVPTKNLNTDMVKRTGDLPPDLGFPFQNDFSGKIQPACKAKFPGLEEKIIVKKPTKKSNLPIKPIFSDKQKVDTNISLLCEQILRKQPKKKK